MSDFSWYAAVVVGIEWLVRLGLVVVVVMRRRPLATNLAWVVVLILVPLVGTVAYLMVGENRLGSRRLRRYGKLTAGMDRQAVRLWSHRHQDWAGHDEDYQHIWRLATNDTGLPPLRGNTVRLISRSEKFLEEIVHDVDAARSHCHLLFYIYTTSPDCWKVSEALMRASRRGVACRLLVDAVGSKHFLRSDAVAKLRRAGVQVVAALPVNPLRMFLARIDLRNHRKIVVIDGRIGYAGSQNLTDSTFRAGWNRRVGPWIDATARVEGPAAQALGVIFLQDWQAESEEDVMNIAGFLPPLRTSEREQQTGPNRAGGGRVGGTENGGEREAKGGTDGGGEGGTDRGADGGAGESVVQVLPSGPGASPDSIHQLIVTAIFAAREELIMTTPYFVPDDALRRSLIAAARRGVAVTLIMPKEADSPVVAAASRANWLGLLEAGVKILVYRGGLLHAKTMTIDRRIGLIGSANLDQRSFWLNFEVTLILYDDELSSELRFLQMSYASESDEIDQARWTARNPARVFRENLALLFGPLL